MWKTLRDLNLSYNPLKIGSKDAEDHEFSIETVENLMKLLGKAKVLYHINLSGMDLKD